MTKGWLLQSYTLPENKKPLWQLKSSDFSEKLIYENEFFNDEQEEPLVSRFIIYKDEKPIKTLPNRLSSEGEKYGAQEIRVEFFAKKGRYTLYFDILESIASDLCLITLNDYEIGAVAVPFAGNIDENGRYKPIHSPFLKEDFEEAENIKEKYHIRQRYKLLEKNLRVFRFEIPFLCVYEGRQVLSFKNAKARLNDTMNTFVGDGFRPLCLSLTKGIKSPKAIPDFFEKHPGRSLIDLWGWMSMTSFEHPANEVTKPARQALRGIVESFKWGANNLEFLPVNADGVALDLTGEEYWKGQESYKLSKDTTWTSEEVENLLNLAHEHGMLCEFFIYCLHGAGFIGSEMSHNAKVNFLEKVMKRYGGCNTVGKVDGIIVEGWFPVDGPRYTEAMWKHNPSSFLLSSNNDGSQYDMINAGYSPALHHYAAHWPGFDTQHTGYDHAYSIMAYPTEFYTKPEGTVYTYLQACAQTHHPRKNFPRVLEMPLYGVTNRTVSHDWIIAQTHGFALRRLVEGNNDLPMALCWEADEETMAPEMARRYVYAASQDPICLAAAGQLADIGEGGELSLKRGVKHNHTLDNTRIRARHRYPKDTYFAQNRFLQLLLVNAHEYAALQVDLSETATFYSSGCVATIGNGYAVTRFEDARFLDVQTELIESVGPVCIVRQNGEMGSGFVSFNQKVTHTIYSEVPAIITEIQRRIKPGQSEDIDTYFDISRYDHVNGVLLEKEKEYFDNQMCYVLEDSTGVLPTMCLTFETSNEKAAKVRYVEGNALYFTQNLKTSHSLKIICTFKMGQFSKMNSTEMLCAVEQTEIKIAIDDDATSVNALGSGMKCVRITNSDETPYFVKEKGWWHFKGPTPSQQYVGSDYLRVYSSEDFPAKIRKYGYLKGGVRPTYGCQNIISFCNLDSTLNCTSFIARLAQPSPMLSSPGIECDRLIESVKLNGNQWQYFENKTIKLPSIAGDYTIEVVYGKCVTPRIVKSHACITNATWEENCLCLKAVSPTWVCSEPYNEYTAYISHENNSLKNFVNCKVVQEDKNGTMISFRQGEIRLYF